MRRLPGRTTDQILGSSGQAEREAIHRRLRSGEPPIQSERRIVDHVGQERVVWTHYRAAAGHAAGGRELYYAFGTDITELRHAEQRLSTVVQGTGVGLWEWRIQTDVVEFNDELIALAGYGRTDVPVDAVRWLHSLIDGDDRDRRKASLAHLVSGTIETSLMQYRVRHRLGHRVWIQEGAQVASRDAGGRPVRIMGTTQDISVLKNQEGELRRLNADLENRIEQRTRALAEAKEQAERANAAKSQFLSQMSHELRTPLNAILGFGQLLELSPLQPEDVEHVGEVMRAGRHLLGLIDEILDLSTVEAGRLHLRTESVPLGVVVDECAKLLRPAAREAGVTIEWPGAPGAAVVRADRGRLTQVVLNLMSNAIKYNRRGGAVAVDVRSDEGADCELRVSDSGAGLTSEQIGRLFQPFERLGAARSAIQGTGIGLSLSKRLMALMGGAIGVSSEPGRGSTFWLRLPRARVSDDPPEVPAPGDIAATVQEPRFPSQRRRVLYVEDNHANQRLMQRMLAQRSDIDLIVTADPSDALDLARGDPLALLLLDIQLPGIDGYQLLGQLRAQGIRAPAVAVSANAMAGDLARGQAAGFAEYLTKPVDLARLLQVLDTLTER
jgi:PAS domain S-box-containing protein